MIDDIKKQHKAIRSSAVASLFFDLRLNWGFPQQHTISTNQLYYLTLIKKPVTQLLKFWVL